MLDDVKLGTGPIDALGAGRAFLQDSGSMSEWFQKRADHEARPSRAEGRPSLTEVSQSLLIGEYPRVEDIGWLKERFAVTAIHNLQDDDDLRKNGLDAAALRRTCEDHAIKLVRTPISDGGADHMAEGLRPALDDLRALIASGERVYLHCNGGLNRAPTLAIAYLRGFEGMSLDEAQAHVKQRRACGPFMTVLEDYFGPRHHKPGKPD
ncbi:MAG: dual specificity protein phosphatase family protein [Candidatus Binataceae bacterium]